MEFKKADVSRALWRLLVCSVMAGVFVIPANAQEDAASKQLNAEIDSMRAQYKEELEAIDGKIAEARKATREKKYPEASGLYTEAQEALQKYDGDFAAKMRRNLENELSKFRAEWSGTVIERARAEFQKENFEDSINFASEAALIDSKRSKEAQKLIELCRQEQKAKGFTHSTSLDVFNPEYQQIEKEVDKLYREARIFYNDRRFDEARRKLEEIYLRDPFNRRANELLEKCYRQLFKYGMYRHSTDVDGIMAYSTWEWIQGVPPVGVERSIATSPVVKTQSTAEAHSKLESIIFPNVEFDDADINSVIRYLDRGAKRNDPEQSNISIIAGFDSTVAATLPKVTMSFSKIPLSEVLRYLCKSVGLKYRMEQNAVIIGMGLDDMQTEYFTVRGDLFASIATAAGEGGGGGDGGGLGLGAGGGGDGGGLGLGAGAGGGSRPTIGSDALISYFVLRGITFEEGASIAYDSRGGRLIVKNTLENLRKMDDLLRQLDAIKFPLVMVEVKIVEINQVDVNELGFDWVFNIPGSGGGDPESQTWSINKKEYAIIDGVQQLIWSGGNPLRYYSADNPNAIASEVGATSSNYKLINDLKIFPNFGESIFGKGMDVNLSFSVNAIAQNTRTETLSTPKILTTSGSEATIEMVERRFYAEDWDDPETSVSGNNVQIKPPTPDWGDERRVGVMMKTTPVVSPDNYTIEMHLQPTIVAFLGEQDYPVAIKTWRTKADGSKIDERNQDTVIKMPIFSERSLDARVKVYNGETIVLGGMIQNQNVNRNDKWPIIGDVPILGRFFSSQLAKTEKVNLLIFVTTRLVNTDGKPVPVPNDSNRGVPEFNR